LFAAAIKSAATYVNDDTLGSVQTDAANRLSVARNFFAIRCTWAPQHIKEASMQKYVLALISSAALLVGSALAATAQQGDIPSKGEQFGQTEQSPGSEDDADDIPSTAEQFGQTEQSPGSEDDADDIPSMVEQFGQTEHSPESEDERGGLMRHRQMTCHMMKQRGMMSGVSMRIIFALMDSDGDGTVSLQEFQAAHERIFKAMDTDKDGTLTLEEIQHFMHGRHKAVQQR